MKEELKTIGILAIAVAIGVAFVLGAFVMLQRAPRQLGGVPQVPSYNTASSTVIAIGRLSSVTALAQRGNRGSAIICNTNANGDVYLMYTSSTVAATTTASNAIFGKGCVQIDAVGSTVYTGQVEAMISSNASAAGIATTTSLIVTEFIGS